MPQQPGSRRGPTPPVAVSHLRSIIALVRAHGSPLTNTEGGALGSARRAGLGPAAGPSLGGLPRELGGSLPGGSRPVNDSTSSQQGWKRRECFYFHPRKLWLQCHKPLPKLPTTEQLYFPGIIVFQTPWDLSPSLGLMVMCPNVSSTAACVAWVFVRGTGLVGAVALLLLAFELYVESPAGARVRQWLHSHPL